MRSCNHARRSSQRGFALILALVLAVLYFGLIELLLLDSARELGEARRLRARIMAETLAENAAELVAVQIVTKTAADDQAEDWQGSMQGSMRRSGEPNSPAGASFDIEGVGVTSGITVSKARVRIRGRVVSRDVRIQYTQHLY